METLTICFDSKVNMKDYKVYFIQIVQMIGSGLLDT